MNKIIVYIQMLVFFVIFFPVYLYALTVNFDGTLVVTPPECTINGGAAVNVNFGDVHESLIDSYNYKRLPIDYTLNCINVYSNALKMTVSWSPDTINRQNVISTNRTNLGIAIYKNTTRLSNGDIINFTNGNQPELYAVPVKPAGMTLTDGGLFYGTLTFIVDYQ
ncbi:fimbrial protein [Morganella morganii]